MNATIDLTFLRGFTSGNQEKMKKYISMFLQLCPNSLKSMKDALDQQDYDALRGAAHALKPQITYMGIKAGEPLVKIIEENAAGRIALENMPALLNEFDAVCRQAMIELANEIG